MIENNITNTKLSIKFEKGSYTNSSLHDNTTNENILKLAKAINSLQAKPAEKFVKIVTSELMYV